MEDTQLFLSVFSFKSVFPEKKSPISFSGNIEGANKVLGGEQRKAVEKECLTISGSLFAVWGPQV